MPKHYDTITQGEAGTSDWILLNPQTVPWSCTLSAVVPSGTLTYSIEITLDPPAGPTDTTISSYTLANMTDLNTNNAKAIIGPIAAVRINITSYTSGSVVLTARQGGGKSS